MPAKFARALFLAVTIGVCALVLSHCSDDNPQGGVQPRIVGNTNLPAELLQIQLPEDCGPGVPAISALSGRLNNVDLNAVKIMMYTTSGLHYGAIRVFNNNGAFSMDLPCGRRVRLLLTKSDWTSVDTLNSGPPPLDDNILAAYWDIDRVLGTVNGVVVDAFNNAALEGVAVSWQVGGVTYHDTSVATGYFSGSTRLASGLYSFEFELAGYAGIAQEVTVPSVDDLRSGPDDYPGDIVHLQALTVALPPLTADLTGTVDVVDPTTTDTLPASGVPVLLIPEEGVLSNSYDTTTDGAGGYGFEEVPAAVTVTVSVPSFDLGGNTYGPADTSLSLWPGMTMLDFVMNSDGGAAFRVRLPEAAR